MKKIFVLKSSKNITNCLKDFFVLKNSKTITDFKNSLLN